MARRTRVQASLTRSLDAAVALSQKSAELGLAAAQVIATRSPILAAGACNPLGADSAEICLMVTEKHDAFSRSAAALGKQASTMADAALKASSREAKCAYDAARRLASVPTPQALAQVQTSLAYAWWDRAVANWAMGTALVLEAQGAAIKPLHGAATRNVRRLDRARAR